MTLWKRGCFIFCGAVVILYEICTDLFLLLGLFEGGGGGRKVYIAIELMVRQNLIKKSHHQEAVKGNNSLCFIAIILQMVVS